MGIEDDISDVHSRLSELENLVATMLTDEQVARLDSARLIAMVLKARTGYDVYVRVNLNCDYEVWDRYSGGPPPKEVLPLIGRLRELGMRIDARKE